jgi:diaminopimelate epimerase
MMEKRKTIPFAKYSGCGNDFIIIDDRDHRFPLQTELVTRLCHRQKGVGADGILLLDTAEDGAYKMRIFNADGSEADMCGNGLRCLAKFIDNIDAPGDSFTICTPYGKHRIELNKQQVTATMGAPTHVEWHKKIFLNDGEHLCHFLNTGVPHAVFFVDNLQKISIDKIGREVRFHPLFAPGGTNATFVQLHQKSMLSYRTYERGVEAETLACGTGAVAAALATAYLHKWESPIQATTREGGILTISFLHDQGSFSDVKMGGPAEEIYHGLFSIA